MVAACCCATSGEPANTTGRFSSRLSRGSKNGIGNAERSFLTASVWYVMFREELRPTSIHRVLLAGFSQTSR
ncbi:hypothetical protein D3C71_2130570 [compost metagenome]